MRKKKKKNLKPLIARDPRWLTCAQLLTWRTTLTTPVGKSHPCWWGLARLPAAAPALGVGARRHQYAACVPAPVAPPRAPWRTLAISQSPACVVARRPSLRCRRLAPGRLRLVSAWERISALAFRRTGTTCRRVSGCAWIPIGHAVQTGEDKQWRRICGRMGCRFRRHRMLWRDFAGTVRCCGDVLHTRLPQPCH